MGFLDSFFGSEMKEAPGPRIKETPWAPKARGVLSGLMERNLQFPTRRVPGMTETEQRAQGVLARIVSGGTFQDPSKSTYWTGLRDAMREEEERGISGLRRRQQLSGMLGSSTGGRQEADFRSRAGSNRMQILGGLYERERDRDNPYTRMAASAAYGGQPREIEEDRARAEQEAALQTLLAPYQYQSPLAQMLLNYQPWYQPQFYEEPSMFSQVAPLIGTVAGGALGGPMGAMAGGAAMGGFR